MPANQDESMSDGLVVYVIEDGRRLPDDFEIYSIRVERTPGMCPYFEATKEFFTLTNKGNSVFKKIYYDETRASPEPKRFKLPSDVVTEMFGRMRKETLFKGPRVCDAGEVKITLKSTKGKYVMINSPGLIPDWFEPYKDEIESLLEKNGYGRVDIVNFDGDGEDE